MEPKRFELKISGKLLLEMLFLVSIAHAIYLGVSEEVYSLQKMSADIQSAMFMIALLFYKEEQK